ncbi:MAG: carboxypeptidase regulatory-like domain-containing protein, partial [Acidobacteria bacterium]|nr:carboxypeptidase regulatory-like domain-containing protein [Acidobacteriota bacterium]
MSRMAEVLGKLSVVLVFALLLLSSHPAAAQITGAAISGVVEDPTGARIPGATMEIKNLDTGISRTTTTDAQGRFTAPSLSLGRYQVSASASGFQTSVRTGITLTVGREAVVNFALEVGAVAQRVEVTGEAPLVNTTSATVGELVAEKEILELPLNGRSYEHLAFLEPGVIFARGATSGPDADRGAGGSKLSIAGTRPEFTAFRLDGTDMIDARGKTPGSALGVSLGVESMREFRVITNPFTAEYARVAGGVVDAVTKSGANQFQGSVFW